LTESALSRIINLENPGKARTHLLKQVHYAVMELIHQPEINEETRDLAAFVSIALEAVGKTIEESVAAWEKRGYWIKADRFRMDWNWAPAQSQIIKVALLSEDWSQVAIAATKVAEKTKNVPTSSRLLKISPWRGAYKELLKTGAPKS
jgi:hypothetical protein